MAAVVLSSTRSQELISESELAFDSAPISMLDVVSSELDSAVILDRFDVRRRESGGGGCESSRSKRRFRVTIGVGVMVGMTVDLALAFGAEGTYSSDGTDESRADK